MSNVLITPTGAIMGNPSQEDIDMAMKLIMPGEQIVAILRNSQKNINNSSLQPLACLLCLPCFWPHALLCSPCICCGCQSNRAVLAATVYVITDKSIHRCVLELLFEPLPWKYLFYNLTYIYVTFFMWTLFYFFSHFFFNTQSCW